jgi:hypothetical protein
MAAFAFGFRDMLEAAGIVALALVALIRLGRGNLTQAVWAGVGAGALLGFSIGTGLIAGETAAAGGAWLAVEIVMMALAVLAVAGVALTARRFAAESGPAVWLAVAAGMFATLPQTLDLLTRLATGAGGAAALVLNGLGVAMAGALAAMLFLALTRGNHPAAPEIAAEEPAPLVSGELAPVRQRVD